MGCSDLNTSSSSNVISIGPSGYDSGHGNCTVDGEDTKIEIYKDAGAQKNQTNLAAGLGCQIAKNFGISEYDYVQRNLWDVSPKTQTTAKKIAAAIGGEAKHVSC